MIAKVVSKVILQDVPINATGLLENMLITWIYYVKSFLNNETCDIQSMS